MYQIERIVHFPFSDRIVAVETIAYVEIDKSNFKVINKLIKRNIDTENKNYALAGSSYRVYYKLNKIETKTSDKVIQILNNRNDAIVEEVNQRIKRLNVALKESNRRNHRGDMFNELQQITSFTFYPEEIEVIDADVIVIK